MSDSTTPKEAGLPVVAWRSRYISEPGMIGHYPWHYLDRACTKVAMAPGYEYRPLADHADAQAVIDALRAEVDELKLAYKVSEGVGRNLFRGAQDATEKWMTERAELAALKAAQPDPFCWMTLDPFGNPHPAGDGQEGAFPVYRGNPSVQPDVEAIMLLADRMAATGIALASEIQAGRDSTLPREDYEADREALRAYVTAKEVK